MIYLDQNLRKALSDRIYDKRKPAALQLEQIVRKAVEAGNTELVDGIITELSRDFAYALRHPNYRNGGLIGLAAVALALGPEGLPSYIDDIIQPILACFGDADSRVRYYACESLYNVAKVAKGEMLAYFNEIFDALCKLTADVEESVRNGANLVDQLMRDIVVETATTYEFVVSHDPPETPPPVTQPEGPEGPTLQSVEGTAQERHSFTLARFIPLLTERIYVINPATRVFLVQWIMLLDSIPDLELIKYLPDFLEGLLLFLTDPNKDVRTFTKTCLTGLLNEIKELSALKKSTGSHSDKSGNDAGLYEIGQDTYIYHAQILDILLSKMDPSHDEIRLVVLGWVGGFLDVSPTDVFAKLSNLVAVLLPALSDEVGEVRQSAVLLNDRVLDMLPRQKDAIDATAATIALSRQLDGEDKITLLAVFEWLSSLYKVHKLAQGYDDLLVKLLSPLSDPSDEVVVQDLNLLALVLKDSTQDEFLRFGRLLIDRFRKDKQLFASRGKFVWLRLCELLSAERVYRLSAEIIGELDNEEDSAGFDCLLIQNMSNILLTAPELHEFRTRFTQLNTVKGAEIFSLMFKSWCRNSVAVLSLCMLAETYEHAYAVLEIMARLDVNVTTLIQIDKLVQLIEGPVFATLRLHLLEPQTYPYLYKTLYGLLMILPQSQAFKILHRRLQSVSGITALPFSQNVDSQPVSEDLVNWDELLTEYRKTHDETKKQS